jgi:hypothetical protein
MLGEIRRILKPGTGYLFVTTPNNENLEASTVFCPECGAVFHRYQHLRSFTIESLEELMRSHGFATTLCNITLFNAFQISPSSDPIVKGRVARAVCALMSAFTTKLTLRKKDAASDVSEHERFTRLLGQGPHLFWLGGKS